MEQDDGDDANEVCVNYLLTTVYVFIVCFSFSVTGIIPPITNTATMLICHRNADYENNSDCDDDHDWSASFAAYPNLEELQSFITRQRQSAQENLFTTTH